MLCAHKRLAALERRLAQDAVFIDIGVVPLNIGIGVMKLHMPYLPVVSIKPQRNAHQTAKPGVRRTGTAVCIVTGIMQHIDHQHHGEKDKTEIPERKTGEMR